MHKTDLLEPSEAIYSHEVYYTRRSIMFIVSIVAHICETVEDLLENDLCTYGVEVCSDCDFMGALARVQYHFELEHPDKVIIPRISGIRESKDEAYIIDVGSLSGMD